MSYLEKYISDHRDEFDAGEPEPGHFQRFEAKLKDQPVAIKHGHNRSLILKVAAAILILISVSVFVFDLATREIRERFASEKTDTELPVEIREAVQYYDNQANTKIAALHKLAEKHEGAGALDASAYNEIQSLDATTEELKKSLAENPGNEHILDAIILNQQMKGSILNSIINQLSRQEK